MTEWEWPFVGFVSNLSGEVERFLFTRRDCSHYNRKLCMSLLLSFSHQVTDLALICRAQLREYLGQASFLLIASQFERGGVIAGNTSQYLGRRLTIMYAVCMQAEPLSVAN